MRDKVATMRTSCVVKVTGVGIRGRAGDFPCLNDPPSIIDLAKRLFNLGSCVDRLITEKSPQIAAVTAPDGLQCDTLPRCDLPSNANFFDRLCVPVLDGAECWPLFRSPIEWHVDWEKPEIDPAILARSRPTIDGLFVSLSLTFDRRQHFLYAPLVRFFLD
jgi:hypothetical protein